MGGTSADDPSGPLGKDVQRALADLLIFAPLGFIKKANVVVPDLVREGRATAQSAQTIGKFLTPVLQRQGKRFYDQAVSRFAQQSEGQPTQSDASLEKPPSEPTIDSATPGPVSLDEPFPGYDHLGSAAVVARLGALTKDEREQVRAYEASHRNRRTVLGRLDQLGF